jgi:Tfp pilus assembly protein PilF
MILRLSSNAHRAALVVAALALLILFSYFSIRNARAAHYAGLQTAESLQRAVQLEPANPQNWYLLGRYWQYNLEDPDAARAIHSYLTALSLNPASAETWLDLATVYESESNLSAARDSFLRAKKAYPLSADVCWRYGNFLLRREELDPAFAEMRLAIQSDPHRAAEAFSRALRVGVSVETIMDRVLPPVPEAYLDVIWDQTSERHPATALQVWDRMASLHPRISLNDSFSLIGALQADRRIAEAAHAWDQAVLLAGFADLQTPPGSILWDGGFESGLSGGGFAWLLSEGFPGVQLGFDSREKHSGNRSLRLIFEGKSNNNFAGVCHFVPVQSSTSYRFSAWVKTRALTTNQGIRFQLHSLGTLDTSTVFTPELHGTLPWTRLDLPWTSGRDVQELQVCLVRFPSQEAENKIQGIAWVDDVSLAPESTGRPKP